MKYLRYIWICVGLLQIVTGTITITSGNSIGLTIVIFGLYIIRNEGKGIGE